MLMRFILGDNIFVSYSRADTVRYAKGLASELANRGFSCRLDQWDSEPGADMPATLVRGLRRPAPSGFGRRRGLGMTSNHEEKHRESAVSA